jgi:hypothetical protein
MQLQVWLFIVAILLTFSLFHQILALEAPTVEIISHEDGQEVPIGELTIEGISSDNSQTKILCHQKMILLKDQFMKMKMTLTARGWPVGTIITIWIICPH